MSSQVSTVLGSHLWVYHLDQLSLAILHGYSEWLLAVVRPLPGKKRRVLHNSIGWAYDQDCWHTDLVG